MKSRFLQASILLLLLGAAAAAHAGAHKWVDANGVTHYSDSAPAGQASTEVRPATPAPDSAQGSALQDEVRKADAMVAARKRKNAADEREAADKRAAEQSLKMKCGYEKNKLQAMQGATRISTINSEGEKVELSAAERQRLLEQSQQAINDNCK